MRDVWVAFIDHPSPDGKIEALRQQMSRQHSMMYESITDIRDLKVKLANRLESWEAVAGSKVPRHVDLLPSSGKEVLRAANLRLRGEKLVVLGQAEAGKEALREAAVIGGPIEQLAYARFQARHGDLIGAYDSTQRAIDHFSSGTSPLYSPLAAEAFAAQAGVLRRQGRDIDAIGRLLQALTLLNEKDPTAQSIRCRILDEIGLAHQKIPDLEAARRYFEASLKARRELGHTVDECQSRINLSRLEVAEGDLGKAAVHAEDAIRTLRGTPPTSLHANAEVLMAQIRLRQGRPDDSVPYAERALSLNRQIANKLGEAISQLVLAQSHKAAGRPTKAEEHARASLELNVAMDNDEGKKRAEWILNQLAT